ncbi:hypothetical protein OS493_003338 [Desmophyllum pertusum]|uniref:Secreted protein n=1 Tax=Desmophyllum pertusum TaxID=174260 RepID=A0A9X0A581_9CNID|nr:hypothetical protein OS493_003338 [Desmophyllum pertusum]
MSYIIIFRRYLFCCMLGLVGTQGPVSSVLIQKHSSEQATSGAPPSRHPYGQRAPPTRTVNTRTSRGPVYKRFTQLLLKLCTEWQLVFRQISVSTTNVTHASLILNLI